MALYHVFDQVDNRRTGVPMEGVQVRVKYDDTDSIAPIYADQSGSDFSPVNYCATDADGMYSFYINPGEYTLEFIVGSVVIKTISDFRPAEVGPSGPANSSYATTVELESADVSNVSAILAETGKAGTFTTRDYADFTAQVAADAGKVNYIRSVFNPTKVWVRTSILSTGAAQTGASSGLTVDDELAAKATLSGVARTATHLGAFTGSTIPDNSPIKAALQAVEAAIEARPASTTLAANGGAALLGTTAGGTGATDRTQAAKNSDFASPEDRGAAGDGATNDSAAFTNAVAVKRNLLGSAGKSYAIKDVPLSNSQSLDGNGALLTAYTGGTNLATLSDYDPRVRNWYVSNGANASQALFRVKASRGARIDGIMAVNVGAGVVNLSPATPASDIIALPFLNNIQAEGVSGTAFTIGQNVSEMRGGNIHAHGTLVSGTGGLKPASGTVGWRQNQPLSGSIARGGHQMSQINMICFETGWYFTDVELLTYDNIIADSCSGFGIVFDGTGNADGIQLSGTYVGTSRGLRVAGNAKVSIDGLTTLYNGSIFSWMASDFYTGTAYDVTLEDTAQLTISGYWRGDKKLNIASTAKLILNCGQKFNGRTVGTVAAASSGYICEFGITGTEGDANWRAPCAGKIVGVTVYNTVAPGAGQSFTYTLRKNFADTAFVVTSTGASAFGGDNWYSGGIAYAAGDTIALKLVTSATAAASRHVIILHFVPD